MSNDSIIVTGAAGFIGTNLVKALNKRGINNLILVDHLSSKKKRNLENLSYRTYYEKDEFLRLVDTDLTGKPSHFIHLGAATDTTLQDKEYLLKNNTGYSKSVFKYCRRNGVRLIYASSAATYGNGDRGYSDNSRKLNPLNYYGFSKYLFDKWVLEQKNLPPQWVGLKFFNVYGPYEGHKDKMASVIYHGYNQIKKSGVLKLFKSYKDDVKDGEQCRDFIYVKDVVNVILYFMDNKNISGIYNVGTGKARTFLDIGFCLFKAVNKKARIKFIEMPENLKDIYQYFTQADIGKLRSAGYNKPFYSLEDGISEYVSSYLSRLA
ncbi:MAG: ADP-glyceromanno-heptose 6-epimerase [Firmicutes bacterium]|nr:ADP-glyceromanno-heptose 6-epimerase [Bacillota bacterium]